MAPFHLLDKGRDHTGNAAGQHDGAQSAP